MLGLLLFWYSWRILKHPIAAAHQTPPPLDWWPALYAATRVSPEDANILRHQILAQDFPSAHETVARLLAENPGDLLLLWLNTTLHRDRNQLPSAEAAADHLFSRLTHSPLVHQPEAYRIALAEKLHAIMLQNDGRFEAECNSALRSLVTDTAKINLLDQLACIPLIHDKPHLYHLAESCIRKALDLAPGTATLQGTLGALLAERGQFTDAEPHLRACYDGTADPTNRGITSYYLALLASQKGDPANARKLAKQSLALYSEPWLAKKTRALLTRL